MSQQDATVIATYSRRMRLRFDNGDEVDARIKGKKLKPVCGDRVSTEPLPDEDDWLITAIRERRNELARPNIKGQREVLAANVDLLVVVAAALPKPDWYVVDRYLCSAELMGVDAAVVFNKIDLEPPDEEAFGVYRRVGYETLAASAETEHGVDALSELLTGKTAIIVGQSGVGKSSLINLLSDESEQRVADISRKHREGRHTTVNSVMIPLPSGGDVIDSPGVRDYAPALTSPEDAIIGFREIHEAGEHCRFANCRHLREPDCAVKSGVENGTIDPRRYESYRRAVALTERLAKDRF